MDSNITINIVEPGSGPVVPNTGLFTSSIGGPEITTISISAVLILTMVAIIITALLYRKQKKSGKVTKLVHLVDSTKAVLKSKKRITAGLTAIALLASAGTLTTLLASTNKNNTNAIDGEATAETESITPIVSNNELTIELADEPVFAILPVDITVEEEMPAGYTLTAYTDNTDLVSTTDSSKVIPMVTLPEAGGELSALTDNTYGLSLVKPETKADEVYTSLSTDQSNPTFITDKDYEHTEANDTTTIYYGFYITPDTPYGTYTSSNISYDVEANRSDLATVTFNSNGLYFDGDESKNSNIVRYAKGATSATEMTSHTLNVNNTGGQSGMYPINTAETFVYDFADANKVNVEVVKSGNDSCSHAGGVDTDAYFSFWSGSHPDYTAEAKYSEGIKAFGNTTGKYVFGDYNNVQTDVENASSVTIAYHVGSGGPSRGCGNGYGYYAIITATDADGNPAYAIGNSEYSGTYKIPATAQYDNYDFLGWSLDPDATSPDFTNAADIETNMTLNAGEKATLYAVWSPIVDLGYDGNNATAGSMESTSYDGDEPTTVTLAHEDVIVGDTINLYAPNYKKTGYGFAGWSTDQNAWDNLTDDDEGNDPTIYGPNETFTMTKDMALAVTDGESTLYAVWAPAEQNNGTPVYLQGWQGCSSLTATTYNTETGKLTVGKNTITALTDSRDREVYTIARLADGNCWMTENLRLDNDATISTTNTNSPIVEEGTTNVVIKNNDGNTSNHLSPNSNSWCADYGEGCYNQSYLNTFNTNLGGEGAIANYNSRSNSERAFQWYSYGNYYNWYSATAGNGTYSTGEQGSETVAGDICPAGWILPIGNETTENGSFSNLDSNMGGTGTYHSGFNNWRSFPNNFVYSGSWDGSSARSRGGNGNYWSSTASSTSGAYYLGFYSGGVDPGTGSFNKDSGTSVRCVAPAE